MLREPPFDQRPNRLRPQAYAVSYAPFDALLPRLVKRGVALRVTARSSVRGWTQTLALLQNDASIAAACQRHVRLMADGGEAVDRIADLIDALQPESRR